MLFPQSRREIIEDMDISTSEPWGHLELCLPQKLFEEYILNRLFHSLFPKM